MHGDSLGRNLLILFGLFFVYTCVVGWVGFLWTNYVVSRGTYDDAFGEILLRALHLLVPLIVSAGVGAAARTYLRPQNLFSWLVALCGYVAVTHYTGYRGIFRHPALSYWVPVALEALVLPFAVLAGVAIASRRMQVEPSN
jgi:hypothetical protein